MATIILSSLGSRGDCHPLLALALRLRAVGHTIRFAVPGYFADDTRAAGYDTIVLAGDLYAAMAPFEQALYGGGSSIDQFRLIIEHDVMPHMAARVSQLRAASADADLLVASGLHIPASVVADPRREPGCAVRRRAAGRARCGEPRPPRTAPAR